MEKASTLEDCALINTAYYDILLDGIASEARVSRLVHGISWTAAVLEDGSCGVAMHTEGESFPRRFETLVSLPAREAARAALSWNFEEASEGMAVLNACYNTAERITRFACRSTTSALEDIDLRGRTIGFVGHLVKHSGITEELLQPAKTYYIMEREPKPGDYPDSACEYLLPQCDLVVITGSAAVNKTMPRLLELAKDAQIVLTGPTVPLCPALLELGISRLNGQAIVDVQPMLAAIVEKRTSVNPFSRHYTLDA